jgi:tryptophan synthase alpha chain
VVVGSALVELVGEHGENSPEHLRKLTASLAKAIRESKAS